MVSNSQTYGKATTMFFRIFWRRAPFVRRETQENSLFASTEGFWSHRYESVQRYECVCIFNEWANDLYILGYRVKVNFFFSLQLFFLVKNNYFIYIFFSFFLLPFHKEKRNVKQGQPANWKSLKNQGETFCSRKSGEMSCTMHKFH